MPNLGRKRGAEKTSEGLSKNKSSSKKRRTSPAAESDGTSTNQQDKQGSDYWELSNTRRVQVTQYGGQTLVDIREYYEKDGHLLPGKKGISLTVPQFGAFLHALPDIYKTLKDQEDGLPVLNLQVSSKAQTTTAAPPEEEADTVEKEDNSSNEGQTQVKDEVDDEGSD